MGVLDAPMAQLAKTLVRTFGRSATIVPAGAGGEYNPATGDIEGASTETSIPCEVVFEEFTEAQIDGTLIKAGDRKAIVSRLRLDETDAGRQPIPQSDTLVEGGRTWQIVRLLGYSSGSNEAAFSLHVRR